MTEILEITTQHPGMEQKWKIPLEQKGDLVQDKEKTYNRRTWTQRGGPWETRSITNRSRCQVGDKDRIYDETS